MSRAFDARGCTLLRDESPASAREVAALIAFTRHDVAPTEADARWLCDIDLVILGSDAQDYADYAGAIPREYAHVEDGKFRAGRVGVLRYFLARSRIHWTDYYYQRLEVRARENVVRELGSL